MTKWSSIKAAALHLALNRDTYYCNSYPWNCLYYTLEKGFGCDCIGLIKSLINNPNQAYTSADQSYVQPGTVIPDWTENELINHCADKSSDFSNVEEGEILMTCIDGTGEEYGHGGWFVGEFTDPHYGCICNTIECTSCYEYDGIMTTYTDENGDHWTSKGGRYIGKWEYHGHLQDYVDFDIQKETNAEPAEETKEETPVANTNEKLEAKETDYYYEGVEFCKQAGIMNGEEDGHFYPDKPVTRGMLATVIKRLCDYLEK